MPIEVKQFVLGPLENNSFIVSNGKNECLIIDPPIGSEKIVGEIQMQLLKPQAIILTHGHFDHIFGIPSIHKVFPGCPVWLHPLDKPLIANPELNCSFMMGQEYGFSGILNDLIEGKMTIGGFQCMVMHIPGHTPGGCALIIENHCFSGDSLFAGSVGRTDLGYGDEALLLKAIKEKLFSLPDATIVHPGHMGRTTIGREKQMNPFFRG